MWLSGGDIRLVGMSQTYKREKPAGSTLTIDIERCWLPGCRHQFVLSCRGLNCFVADE
jgi:hypothetical protein